VSQKVLVEIETLFRSNSLVFFRLSSNSFVFNSSARYSVLLLSNMEFLHAEEQIGTWKALILFFLQGWVLKFRNYSVNIRSIHLCWQRQWSYCCFSILASVRYTSAWTSVRPSPISICASCWSWSNIASSYLIINNYIFCIQEATFCIQKFISLISYKFKKLVYRQYLVFCQLPAEKVPISVNHVIVVIMFGRLNRMEDKLGVRLGKSMGRYVVYFLLQLLYCFICSCFDE